MVFPCLQLSIFFLCNVDIRELVFVNACILHYRCNMQSTIFQLVLYYISNDFIILQLIDDLPMRDMETFKTDQTIATYDI